MLPAPVRSGHAGWSDNAATSSTQRSAGRSNFSVQSPGPGGSCPPSPVGLRRARIRFGCVPGVGLVPLARKSCGLDPAGRPISASLRQTHKWVLVPSVKSPRFPNLKSAIENPKSDWCPGWDSNPHAFKGRRILSPLRLPIPPPGRFRGRGRRKVGPRFAV